MAHEFVTTETECSTNTPLSSLSRMNFSCLRDYPQVKMSESQPDHTDDGMQLEFTSEPPEVAVPEDTQKESNDEGLPAMNSGRNSSLAPVEEPKSPPSEDSKPIDDPQSLAVPERTQTQGNDESLPTINSKRNSSPAPVAESKSTYESVSNGSSRTKKVKKRVRRAR